MSSADERCDSHLQHEDPPYPRRDLTRAGFRALIAALLAVGMVARVAPLFDQGGRLLRRFPTEDGYLTLTIARNIAIGKGVTTADGTIPTNGTQPLCTFLWAICYWLVDGDKVRGVLVVQIVCIAFSGLAAYALYRLGRTALADYSSGRSVAALASALWFTSPVMVPHTMNCLETGPYALAVIAATYAFVAGSRDPNTRWSVAHCIGLGALLGLVFWARIDGCFLALAACLARVCTGVRHGRDRLVRRIQEAAIMGATALILASPWLIYNRVCFGSLMPTSGIAFFLPPLGQNLIAVPADLFAHMLAVFPRIGGLVSDSVLVFGSTLVVLIVLVWLALEVYRPARPTMRAFLTIVGLYGLSLCVFYGLFFAAGHFMNRYLCPLAAFTAMLWARLAVFVWHALKQRLGAPIAALAPLAFLGLIVAVHVHEYQIGDRTLYFQFVCWTKAHIPEQTWIGAGQSGTLGYFHDRTINLDGKVNPEALHARLHGQLAQYILDKNIRYVIDWDDIIAQVMQTPVLKPHFVVEVMSPKYRLGVLRRVTQPPNRPAKPAARQPTAGPSTGS